MSVSVCVCALHTCVCLYFFIYIVYVYTHARACVCVQSKAIPEEPLDDPEGSTDEHDPTTEEGGSKIPMVGKKDGTGHWSSSDMAKAVAEGVANYLGKKKKDEAIEKQKRDEDMAEENERGKAQKAREIALAESEKAEKEKAEKDKRDKERKEMDESRSSERHALSLEVRTISKNAVLHALIVINRRQRAATEASFQLVPIPEVVVKAELARVTEASTRCEPLMRQTAVQIL